jgi:hypothetical protein
MAVALTWLLAARGVSGTPIQLARRVVDMTIVITALFLTGVLTSPWFQQPITPWIGESAHLSSVIVWLGLTVILCLSIPFGWLGRLWTRRKSAPRLDLYVNAALIVVTSAAAVSWALLSGAPDLGWIYISPWGNALALAAILLVGLMFSGLQAGMPHIGSEQAKAVGLTPQALSKPRGHR